MSRPRLETLPLSRSYANQQIAIHIAPEDEAVILPHVVGAPGGYAAWIVGVGTSPSPL